MELTTVLLCVESPLRSEASTSLTKNKTKKSYGLLFAPYWLTRSVYRLYRLFLTLKKNLALKWLNEGTKMTIPRFTNNDMRKVMFSKRGLRKTNRFSLITFIFRRGQCELSLIHI